VDSPAVSDHRFFGKVVLVAGAARGIGRAIAEFFAKLRAKLALADIQGKELDEFAHTVPKTIAVVLDLRLAASVTYGS